MKIGEKDPPISASCRFRLLAMLCVSIAVVSLFPGTRSAIAVMAIQPDGRIVVAGQGFLRFGALARYNPDGGLDPTFGRAGIVIDHRAAPFEALALQPGGRIVSAAHQLGGDRDGHPMLYRYRADGSPDQSFGDHGSVFEPYEYPGKEPRTVIARPDGGLYVAVNHEGIAKASVPSHGVVDAFSADGSFEAEIGRLDTDVGYYEGSWVGGIALQADGSVIGAGAKGDPTRSGSGILARFSPASGQYPLDPTFGAGVGQVPLSPDFRAASVLVNADKIIVVGVSQGSLALTRYSADGSLDASFGTSGIAKLVPPPDGTTQFAEAAAVQPDGKIVVVGTSQNKESKESEKGIYFYDPHVLVARFNPNGTVDSSFGSAGVASLANPSADDLAVDGEGVALQGDGKIVISGTPPAFAPGQPADIVLARFNADGTLDPTFGSGGIVATETCPGDRAQRQRAGCLPKPTVRLAVGAVSGARPTLRLTARSNASWANIYKVKLIVPPGLRIPRRYSKGAKIPIRSSGIEHIIGMPHRHSILFAVRSPRARVALLPGALQWVGKVAARQRLRFRVKVDLFFSEASTSFTLLRPAGSTGRQR